MPRSCQHTGRRAAPWAGTHVIFKSLGKKTTIKQLVLRMACEFREEGRAGDGSVSCTICLGTNKPTWNLISFHRRRGEGVRTTQPAHQWLRTKGALPGSLWQRQEGGSRQVGGGLGSCENGAEVGKGGKEGRCTACCVHTGSPFWIQEGFGVWANQGP